MTPLLLLLLGCPPKPDPVDTDTAGTSQPTDSTPITADDSGTDTTTTAGYYTDDDGDGWSEAEGDCDDADPERRPERWWEACDNKIDDDCDGRVDEGCGDGTAYVWAEHVVTTDADGAFVAGLTGGFFRRADGSLVCAYFNTWYDATPAPSGCPGCLWSFGLAQDGWGSEGDGCDLMDLDVTEASVANESYWDEISYVGYAPEAVRGEPAFDVYQAMVTYREPLGWFVTAYYNLPARGTERAWIDGYTVRWGMNLYYEFPY